MRRWLLGLGLAGFMARAQASLWVFVDGAGVAPSG